MDWAELEEPESATLAAGGADAGASSGLEGQRLNWNDIRGWAEFWRGSDGFLVVLAVGHDSGPSPWGGWVRLRGNRSQDEEVGWSSLSENKWRGGGFLGEGEEG